MTSIERHIRRRMRRSAKRARNKAAFLNTVDDASKVFSFWNLLAAGLMCCKGVRWKASVQKFELHLISNCWKIKQQVITHTWRPKQASHFLLFDAGKLRQIDSVNIWTRTVQCCLCKFCIIPIAERSAVNDSYSSRPNKGTDYAIAKFKLHLNKTKQLYDFFYVYIFDFHKFFASIEHRPLLDILNRYLTDKTILYVINAILTMFNERGLQLGSHFSQACAVLLGIVLDNYIKSQNATSGYGRYSDDGFIIDNSLPRLIDKVIKFENKAAIYGLSVNKDKAKILTSNSVICFLKKRFAFNSDYIYIRILNKSARRTRQRIKHLFNRYDQSIISIDDILLSYNTWASYATKYNSKHTVRNVQQYIINKLEERSIAYEAQRYYVHKVY